VSAPPECGNQILGLNPGDTNVQSYGLQALNKVKCSRSFVLCFDAQFHLCICINSVTKRPIYHFKLNWFQAIDGMVIGLNHSTVSANGALLCLANQMEFQTELIIRNGIF